MPHFYRSFFVLLIAFLSACSQYNEPTHFHFSSPPWAHLELGAGNYGEDGHTKKSVRKTALMELTYISKTPSWYNLLPEQSVLPLKPENQYFLLFETLDLLVKRQGPNGVFHVNDLIPEHAEYATKCLKKYAKNQGYDNINIETIPGDYLTIRPEQTLEKYGLKWYDSVHLKNPEVSFFNYGMDGDQMLSSAKSRRWARTKLQRLANLSKKGLYFFTLDAGDDFIPKKEKEEYICKGQFYIPTTAWEPVPYYFPEGSITGEEYGRVYFIERSSLPFSSQLSKLEL